MQKQIIKTILLSTLFFMLPGFARAATLSLADTGTGINRVVTVESSGQFRLAFEASMNYGLSKWYDLVNDPGATTDLLQNPTSYIPTHEQGALFNQLINPGDLIGHIISPLLFSAQANVSRTLTVIENTPSRVIIENGYSPMIGDVNNNQNIIFTDRYYIYPNGKIYVNHNLYSRIDQAISAWWPAIIGLGDPSEDGSSFGGDTHGWIRSTGATVIGNDAAQSPYTYTSNVAKYIYAYWSPATAAPYTNWTKASVLLVPKAGNANQGKQYGHTWKGFKRWYYGGQANNPVSLTAGQNITHQYLIQLGTQGSSVLPNIASSAAADPIANAYLSNPVPPGVVDAQAPSVPNNLVKLSATASSVTISWNPATDDVMVAGYKVYRNGNEVASQTGTSYSDTGLGSGISYAYTVAAYDNAGNISAQSSVLNASTIATIPGFVELGQSGTAPAGNRTPNFYGLDLFANGAWLQEMKRDITSDPVDPNSDHLVSLMAGVNMHVDFSSVTANGGNSIYGIPINVVAGTQPTVPVTITAYARESECAGNPCMANVPIPANPSIENYYNATTPPTAATLNDGADHHLLIAQRNESTGKIDKLWELYQAYKDPVTGWRASSISIFDMTTGVPRRLGWTSADAAGLPMLPLMPRYDEYVNGSMNHALRVTLNAGAIKTRYVWPARHAAFNGSPMDGIPFGGRLRLKASWYNANKSSFSGEARAIVDTMYRYGIINADTGGMLFLSGVSDERWNRGSLMTLQNIPSTAFEVIKLAPVYNITGPSCLQVGRVGTFTVSHYPSYDSNFSTSHYISVDGNPIDAHVVLSDGASTGMFNYTPSTAGNHILVVDQGGEYSLAPPGFNVMATTGTCSAGDTTAPTAPTGLSVQ